MMLVDALLVATLLGLLMRGTLKKLALLEIKGLTLMILAMLMQFVFLQLGGRGSGFAISFGRYFYVLSFVILLFAVWQNRRDAAFWVIGLGILLNFAVIVINGGHMPVSEAGLQAVGLTDMIPQLQDGSYITHSLMTPETKLKFLADIFPTPDFYPRDKVFSVGDILMAAGVLWLIPRAMLGQTSLQGKTGLKG